MPIYEFYCARCNTIYNFLAKSANTAKIPLCPRCKNIYLTRQMSVFSTRSSGRHGEEEASDPFAGADERKVERGLEELARQADKIGDDDPRAAALLMRKFSALTGVKLGDGFEEALKRMERGEDPEKIAEDIGDSLAEEDIFEEKKKTGQRPSPKKTKIDEKLYEL